MRCISRQADCLATSWMLVTGGRPIQFIKVQFYATILLGKRLSAFQLKVCPECGMCALSRTAAKTLYYRCKMLSDKKSV